MKHIPWICEKDPESYEHQNQKCPICDWGLNGCSVCGTWEGVVPTDCPGYKIDLTTEEQIAMGEIDYKDGRWVAGVKYDVLRPY